MPLSFRERKHGNLGSRLLFAGLALVCGNTAAESLPPLRVDPALLGAGISPREPAPIPVAPVTVTMPSPVASSETAPALKPQVPQSPATPAAKTSSSSAPKAKASVAPRRSNTPDVEPSAQAITPVAPIPAPIQSPVTATTAPQTSASRREATPDRAAENERSIPPVVADRPPLPPLYSAHVAAGAFKSSSLPQDSEATTIVADSITGVNDVEVIATGNADLRKQDKRLTADKITFWDLDAEVEAVGNVHLTQNKDSVEGPYLRMKTEEETGFFDRPIYRMERKSNVGLPTLSTFDQAIYPGEVDRSKEIPVSIASGVAERLDFEGKDKYRFTNGTYSTCQPAQGEKPDWYARASSFELDYVEEAGIGHHSMVFFQGVPILYSPWMSFSLNNKRRSGLLTPSVGTSTTGGFQYTQPLYWNIAPEKDATLTAKFLQKRGTLLQGEFRYIAPTLFAAPETPTYIGNINVQALPSDKITGASRSSISMNHSHNLGHGFTGGLTFNGASDHTFLSDISTTMAAAAQANLLRQGTLAYAAPSGWWSGSLVAQSYQTLQDPKLPPLTKPYTQLPSLSLAANRSDLPFGMVLGFNGQFVKYSNPTLMEATRITAYPQLSLPLLTPATFITPKLGLHSTYYSLNRQAAGVPDTITRNVPIFSVDSGITFERQANWFAKDFTQTLEPRLHYLYVPYRDQSILNNAATPINFDSGRADFNFATIFSENRYSGNDRIGDANQLTAMVASRLLDSDTGAEIIRGAVGQRIYFSTEQVALPGEVLKTTRKTDFLASLSGRVAPHLYIDTGTQYSTELSRTERLSLSASYQPESGKALSSSYRYTRNQLAQVDVTAQWPIWGRLNAVGRVNYSTKEKRLIENLLGLEYDTGCWAARAVMQEFVSTAINSTPTSPAFTSKFAFMLQLELKGFANMGFGENAKDLLKRQIPGYGIISSSAMDASLSTQ